jgi:hypothetical protein
MLKAVTEDTNERGLDDELLFLPASIETDDWR